MAAGRKRGTCVYCYSRGRMTMDHIPPKCLFAELPPKAITVPCCESCRGRQHKDDEYFCHRILLRDEIAARDDIKILQPRIRRALAHPKKQGYRADFEDSLLPVEVTTRTGLYLGTRAAYRVDNLRLDTVVSRIIRGFFFVERRRRLPRVHEAIAWSLDGLPADYVTAVIEPRLIRPLLHEPERIIGDRVFAYRFQRVKDAPSDETVWLLVFFEKVIYIGMTFSPPEC